MKIHVMLHGQTDFDAEGRIQGKSDQHLNDTGKEHALKAAESLQGKGINMIISSPQTHALETAEIIAEQFGIEKTSIVKAAMLKERDFGDYEGELASEVDMFALCSWGGNVAVPNGESVKDSAQRVFKYLNNVFKLFKARTILMIVPEYVLMVIRWHFNGLPKPGEELVIDTDDCIYHELDTETIPPEMVDYQSLFSEQGDADNADRVLSQDEIDALIRKIAEPD